MTSFLILSIEISQSFFHELNCFNYHRFYLNFKRLVMQTAQNIGAIIFPFFTQQILNLTFLLVTVLTKNLPSLAH